MREQYAAIDALHAADGDLEQAMSLLMRCSSAEESMFDERIPSMRSFGEEPEETTKQPEIPSPLPATPKFLMAFERDASVASSPQVAGSPSFASTDAELPAVVRQQIDAFVPRTNSLVDYFCVLGQSSDGQETKVLDRFPLDELPAYPLPPQLVRLCFFPQCTTSSLRRPQRESILLAHPSGLHPPVFAASVPPPTTFSFSLLPETEHHAPHDSVGEKQAQESARGDVQRQVFISCLVFYEQVSKRVVEIDPKIPRKAEASSTAQSPGYTSRSIFSSSASGTSFLSFSPRSTLGSSSGLSSQRSTVGTSAASSSRANSKQQSQPIKPRIR